MACEKYLAWMSDASLGALAPGREPELLAHAATCDACRQAYEHAREVAAFVDRGVASLMSGNPSPLFATRLRARLAAEPTPTRMKWLAAVISLAPASPEQSRWASRPLFSLGAAAVALTVVLVIILTRTTPSTSTRPNPIANVTPKNSSPSAAVAIPLPANSVGPARSAGFVRPAHPRNPPTQELLVLIEPGQFAAVIRFADQLHSGPVDTAQFPPAEQPFEEPLEVAPIEIAPLDAPPTETPAAPAAENSSRH
jgi:hypothetical protein